MSPLLAAVAALVLAVPAAAQRTVEDVEAQIRKLQAERARLQAEGAASGAAAARPSREDAEKRKAAFAAKLEARYGVTLTEQRVRCPCVQYGVAKKGAPLGVIKGDLLGRTPEQTEAELEGGLRALVGLPPKPEEDDWDAFAAELAGRYGVALERQSVRCPCVQFGASKDGQGLGSITGEMLGRTPEQTRAELEDGLKALLGKGAVDIAVDPAAKAIMQRYGVTLQGTVLTTRAIKIDLNADGKTARVTIDATADGDTLVVRAVNKDGSDGGGVRIVRGEVVP